MDKGFDFSVVREALAARQYIEHIRSRGEEVAAKQEIPGYRARRWVAYLLPAGWRPATRQVVERTHSWINRFRRLLIRWEKKVLNYLAMLELACAYITFRAAEVFG